MLTSLVVTASSPALVTTFLAGRDTMTCAASGTLLPLEKLSARLIIARGYSPMSPRRGRTKNATLPVSFFWFHALGIDSLTRLNVPIAKSPKMLTGRLQLAVLVLRGLCDRNKLGRGKL